MTRDTFEFLLDNLREILQKQPTNSKPNPTTVERQLASTLYRYAHGVSFLTIGDLFGMSKELACRIFHKTTHAMVYLLYDDFVKLPATEKEWEDQAKGFIKRSWSCKNFVT